MEYTDAVAKLSEVDDSDIILYDDGTLSNYLDSSNGLIKKKKN